MKFRISQFIFAFLICYSFCSFAFGQEKPVALKFDEFFYNPNENSSPLTDRSNRFARQMVKEPKPNKAVIIYYNQRKGQFPLKKGADWADYTRGVMENGYEIPSQRIVSINGGYREYATLEYWIVPQNAVLPKPTPTVNEKELIICPEINVRGDDFRQDSTQPLNFSVSVKGEEPGEKLSFDWKISSGRILEGQGTSEIKIGLSGTNSRKITASVQISSLAPECNNYDFFTTEVGMFPYKFAEIQYNYSYLAALLDGIYNELNNDFQLKGYIIIYGRRVGNSEEVLRSIKTTREYLLYRKFDSSRITIIHGGFREEGAVEIYLVPEKVEFPKPTPTVDEKFVTFTDKVKKKKTIRKRKR